MTETLRGRTEVCRCGAELPGAPWFALPLLLISCALIFIFGGRLPYGVFLKLGALTAAAGGLNRLMRRGVFETTYVLTDDGTLVFLTKYGFWSRETAVIDTSRAEFDFEGKSLTFEGRKYDFYPDEKLKKLLARDKNK